MTANNLTLSMYLLLFVTLLCWESTGNNMVGKKNVKMVLLKALWDYAHEISGKENHAIGET